MRMMKLRGMIVFLLLCAAGTLFAADAKQMSVTVKTTQVRATPGYLGKVLGELKYGDRVTLLDQPGDAPKDWLKIMGPDKKLQGWVNASSLTQKEIVLKSSTTQVAQSASSGDVALAGKGFNSDVEKQYKENEHLDYTWVDKMEAFLVTPEQVSLFLSQGGLSEQGGAQ
jgi:uncharacterized protein YgiM (DUF1202 family)